MWCFQKNTINIKKKKTYLYNNIYDISKKKKKKKLHSHSVRYGSGSGEQSVTGFGENDDSNSYWTVTGKYGVECERGFVQFFFFFFFF